MVGEVGGVVVIGSGGIIIIIIENILERGG